MIFFRSWMIRTYALLWLLSMAVASQADERWCNDSGHCVTVPDDKELRMVPKGTQLQCVEVTGINLEPVQKASKDCGLVVSPSVCHPE